VTLDGTVNGYSITTINDTAGLGMKAKEEAFSSQYANKQVEKFTVTKTGATSEDEIDAISGATISSNAVTNAVNASLAYYRDLMNVTGGELLNE
jgi:electron transport complex protein RnfG